MDLPGRILRGRLDGYFIADGRTISFKALLAWAATAIGRTRALRGGAGRWIPIDGRSHLGCASAMAPGRVLDHRVIHIPFINY